MQRSRSFRQKGFWLQKVGVISAGGSDQNTDPITLPDLRWADSAVFHGKAIQHM